MKIHNVFHLNLFQEASIDLLIDQVNKSVSLVIINNEKEREVENILHTRSHQNKIQYRVK